MHEAARYRVESNRLHFLYKNNKGKDNTWYHLNVSDSKMRKTFKGDFADARKILDQCKTAGQIAKVMNASPNEGMKLGNRNRQVNFTAAARPADAPYTIEFRQARGSLNPIIIQKWVEFCIGLVRVAKRYAKDPTKIPMENFKQQNFNDKLYIMRLMRQMNMNQED